jgi:hypothetical protein
VIDADSIVKTNPSFYIPDENNTTMQIAGNRNNNRNENIA